MIPFGYDAETTAEKAFVRHRQASVAQRESFLALRAAAGVLQVVAAGLTMLAVLGAVGMLRSSEPRFLDVDKGYLIVALILFAIFVDLVLLVLADVLTLQVSVARNTRMSSLILAEMNLAQANRAEAEERLRGGGAPKASALTPENTAASHPDK